ncbi:hypothetical protein QO004_002835 [Rhizobium mesoamericanum]|nr:hypothetical protein [Rhizobium mesoamericanum]
MNVQSKPYRVASQSLVKLLTPSTTVPRPWVDLPPETRKQLAQKLVPLLMRMRSIRVPTKVDRHAESDE